MFERQSGGLDALLHRPRPSAWREFLRAPCSFLARTLYTFHRPTSRDARASAISVVCISDTHNSQPALPDGDILIHAGDLTQSGSLSEMQTALAWLRSQPHPHKFVTAGNHDLLLDPSWDPAGTRRRLNWGDIIYLEDSIASVTVRGRNLRVFGSPRSPRHGNWAFQYARTEDVWAETIPENVDVLVTHGAPAGHLDGWPSLGCGNLLRALWRVRPVLHVFGHIHDGYGVEEVEFGRLQQSYEQVLMHGGGMWNLLRVVGEFAKCFFTPAREARCCLVNASAVGGLRDDQTREAISILI